MTKEELIKISQEEGGGSYEYEWEDEDWFEELTKDREVVEAMLIMSDAECFLEGPLKRSVWKKDKAVVMQAISIHRSIWGNHQNFDPAELWDFADESLHDDAELKTEIGVDA